MNFLLFFGILSGIFGICAYVPYVKNVLSGNYPPERVTWWTWFILDLFSFVSSKDAGATHTLILMGSYMLGALTISILSIKKGKGGATTADKICVVIVAINLILIFALGYYPDLVLILTITAGLVGSFPTFRQAWKHPEELPLFPWTLFLTSTFLSFLTITEWNRWQILAIPVAFTIIQSIIAIPLMINRINVKN